MNSGYKYFIMTLVFMILLLNQQVTCAQSNSVPPEIIRSFKTGDSNLLKSHLGEEVKLNILGKEYETGQEEAIDVLSGFFNTHTPVDFEIKFESEKKDSKFVIASLHTGNGNFRVNLFFRKGGNKEVIQLLRIEKENDASF